ncbi:MAG: hypothetical protein KBT75_14070 [Oleispira antarctica]|nr:hypothetical protein [Oleispira antarctica]MBQ0793379.1 hypothetical protein [Oleispira antarctica]
MGQLFIKRITLILCLAACTAVQISTVQAANDKGYEAHQGHSDHLLVLIHHKISLQKLQKQQVLNPTDNTLLQQGEHLRTVMPILRNYMATPKSYYLTTEMYHDSLENRAAMLTDFSALLIEYQKQLVSPP